MIANIAVVSCSDGGIACTFPGTMSDVIELAEFPAEFDDTEHKKDQQRCQYGELDQVRTSVVSVCPTSKHVAQLAHSHV